MEVPEVVILLENMAGTGNVIGGKFEELRLIMGTCEIFCHLHPVGHLADSHLTVYRPR